MCRSSSLLVLAAIALHACGWTWFDRTEPPDPSHAIGDPGIERSACPPGDGAPAFRRVSEDTRGKFVMLGACGELAWNEAGSGVLRFAGADEAPHDVTDAGQALWLEGDRVLFREEAAVTLEAGGVTAQSWPIEGAWVGGKVRANGPFWVCAEGSGIVRLDPSSAVTLTPDFLKADPWISGCAAIGVSRAGAIGYPTDGHRLGVVDVATGADRTLEQPFYVWPTADPEGLDRSDAILLSPDGALVFHEKRWSEFQGDQLAQIGDGEVTAWNTDASKSMRLPGALAEVAIFGGGGVANTRRSPWMGTSRGVFVPGGNRHANLVGLDAPIAFEGVAPLVIRGNHLFLETRTGAALLELGSGELHAMVDAPGIEAVVPFRWGGPVAVSHFTLGCIHWPDRPGVCHTQIWGLSRWDAKGGARRVLLGTQPLHVHAIGPDGRMVVGGRILDEAPPDVAAAAEVDWRTLLIEPDGRVVRELDPDASVLGGLGGEHFAVLERARREGGERTEELVAIDWSTGEERLLLTARYVDAWSLDHADRRLTTVVTPPGDDFHQELWSGVVPR